MECQMQQDMEQIDGDFKIQIHFICLAKILSMR